MFAARRHLSLTTSQTAVTNTFSTARNSPSTPVPRPPTPPIPIRTASRGSNFTPIIVLLLLAGAAVISRGFFAVELAPATLRLAKPAATSVPALSNLRRDNFDSSSVMHYSRHVTSADYRNYADFL